MKEGIETIVLVDDDEDDAIFFTEALTYISPSLKVKVAINCNELNDNLVDPLPDCIFLDLNMPKKSGVDCLREIRSEYKFNHIPIIIYSTSQSKKDIERCFNEKADFYLVKPNNFMGIIETLKFLFNKLAKKENFPVQMENFVVRYL